MDRNIKVMRRVKEPQQGDTIDQLRRSPQLGEPTEQKNSSDKWYEQLVKYIPAESLSLYIAMDNIIKSVNMKVDEQKIWLTGALILCIIFNLLYLVRIWKIKLNFQLIISTVALIAYVFSIGGVFATFDFYRHFQSALVLVITTAFLALCPPPKIN